LSLVYWDLVFKEALLACTQFQHVYTQPNSEPQALAWSIGIGRLGGIGPAVGGVLIGLGLSMSTNFLIFAIPTALAGLMTWYLSTDKVS
jgi:hypothetical protein